MACIIEADMYHLAQSRSVNRLTLCSARWRKPEGAARPAALPGTVSMAT
ncbi:hypothetical protein ACNKHK_03695 [Shigella flexneri]